MQNQSGKDQDKARRPWDTHASRKNSCCCPWAGWIPHITREVSKLQSKGSSIPPHTCKRPVPPSEHRPGQGQGHCAEHQPARADLRVNHPKSTVRLTVQTSFGEAEKKTYRVVIKIWRISILKHFCKGRAGFLYPAWGRSSLRCPGTLAWSSALSGCRRRRAETWKGLQRAQQCELEGNMGTKPDLSPLYWSVRWYRIASDTNRDFHYAQPSNKPKSFSHQMLFRKCFAYFICGKHEEKESSSCV